MWVASNSWFDRVSLSIPSHVRTLTLTDVQTPFPGTPLVPLKFSAHHLPRVPNLLQPLSLETPLPLS